MKMRFGALILSGVLILNNCATFTDYIPEVKEADFSKNVSLGKERLNESLFTGEAI